MGTCSPVGGIELTALFTPGHAPGHLALLQRDTGTVVAGDLVAGVGTIAIDPREGNLQDYLDSLERLKQEGATTLLPAHGPALTEATAVIEFYVAHRHSRSEQIAEALSTLGEASPLELAPVVYPDLDPTFHPLAAAQILTHLHWLRDHGMAKAISAGKRWVRA